MHADTDMMALHVSAVCRGAPDKLVIADMRFLAARKGLRVGIDAVQSLMQAGAHAIKIEGEQGVTELIAHSVESGAPIMGHRGLTPQSVHALGGMRVQGRDDPAVQELLESARRLQEAGCFAIVLECVPSAVGKQVAETVEIPVIGIGPGADTNGQVLVLQDLLGADPSFKPRFVRRYLDLHGDIRAAVNRFHADVHGRGFPGVEESYA